MDFAAFLQRIDRTQCPKWTPRQKRLEALNRALHGRLYADLKYAFSQENEGADGWGGKRVLLDNRRAAVQDRLPAELVRDVGGMLFGESHRPTIVARDDDTTSDWIQAFVKDTHLWLVMFRALWAAAIGSGCIVLRVLGEQEKDAAGGFVPKGKGAYHFEIWPTYQCRPTFHRTAPNQLKSLERVWFVGQDVLAADGYDVDDLLAFWQGKKSGRRRPATGSEAALLRNVNSDWALRVVLDEKDETWYKPVPRWLYERADWQESDWERDGDPELRDGRSMRHDVGEVTALWARPLPLDDDSMFPDGMALIEPVIDFQFRIDRTLSQVGRAFDYAGDPQMARIFDKSGGGAGAFGDVMDSELALGGTASDTVDQVGGDVKFVEITAQGLAVAIETYVKTLEERARATAAMSRVSPESKAGTELSAVALRMLNFGQTVLGDILRTTMGEECLLGLLRLAMRMWEKVDVALPSFVDKQGKPRTENPNPAAIVELNWPDYYPLYGQDKLFEVQATSAAVENGLLSQEHGVSNVASQFDVQDAADELQRIQTERDNNDARDLANASAHAEITAQAKAAASGDDDNQPQRSDSSAASGA